MYKLYEFTYLKDDTQEYYCKQILITDNPEEIKRECEKNDSISGVQYDEIKINGFKITIEKEI